MSKSFGGKTARPPHNKKPVKVEKQIQPIEQSTPAPIPTPKPKPKAPKKPMALYFDIDPAFIDEDGYVELKIPAPKVNPELYRLRLSWELKSF